ncbi:NYN domain-containing protein, partial [Legionella pneumophila]|uniref:hypothetical protein n=1 Tax=Legionella pneumophila TaxID=446 RepID=UPI001135F51A
HVALKLVTLAAQATDDDVVILAAHDTDQEPALELAHQLAGKKVETAGWDGARILRIKGGQKWHTKLHEEHFRRCVDLKHY